MGGTSAGAAQKEQKAQDVTQQTKALQSTIHRWVDSHVQVCLGFKYTLIMIDFFFFKYFRKHGRFF